MVSVGWRFAVNRLPRTAQFRVEKRLSAVSFDIGVSPVECRTRSRSSRRFIGLLAPDLLTTVRYFPGLINARVFSSIPAFVPLHVAYPSEHSVCRGVESCRMFLLSLDPRAKRGSRYPGFQAWTTFLVPNGSKLSAVRLR